MNLVFKKKKKKIDNQTPLLKSDDKVLSILIASRSIEYDSFCAIQTVFLRCYEMD